MMRGFLIGLATVAVLGVGGFVMLLVTADNMAPEAEEIRVDVTESLDD